MSDELGDHNWTHVDPTSHIMVCRACKRVVQAVIDLASGTPRLRFYDRAAPDGRRFKAKPPKGCPMNILPAGRVPR